MLKRFLCIYKLAFVIYTLVLLEKMVSTYSEELLGMYLL